MIAIESLAAEGQASLFLMLAGVVLVVFLIGAFWYGSRRRRRAAAARPAEQNPIAQRREDAWQTPQERASSREDQENPRG